MRDTVLIVDDVRVNREILSEILEQDYFIMTAEDGNSLVLALQEQGIPAVVVGKITDSNDRLIFNGEEKRFLDKPAADEIYKFI